MAQNIGAKQRWQYIYISNGDGDGNGISGGKQQHHQHKSPKATSKRNVIKIALARFVNKCDSTCIDSGVQVLLFFGAVTILDIYAADVVVVFFLSLIFL